ncbi:hypothetical protein DYQ86_13625 [Acidobacteria bacterium AB60]|nr:hypothetical protein DYQ86_13625 [Acidobacteria bacterium AB60]
MHPENPIIQLCVAGMEQESKGDFDAASNLFLAAWDQATDDYERCIAAHYVARHQANPEEALTWNQRSLALAQSLPDERVRGFFPSLYLNVGKAFEDLARPDEARQAYTQAAERLSALPEDEYGRTVRAALHRALQRVSSTKRGAPS